VRKDIPHNHVDLPPLISIEISGACIQISNSKVLLVAVYKSPGYACNETRHLFELLSLKRKSLLADLNAKYPFWNTIISNISGAKLLNLLHTNEFGGPAPQCPTHYSRVGNGDVLDTVVHKNVQLSEVTVSDILDSDHYQSFSTCWIMLEIGSFRTQLTNSQIGSSFKAWTLK
jgi:hypothetical protein